MFEAMFMIFEGVVNSSLGILQNLAVNTLRGSLLMLYVTWDLKYCPENTGK